MKKYILKLTLGIIASFAVFTASAQCPAITCPVNISVNNDGGMCDAVVSYTAPTGFDPCGTGSQTFNYTGAMQTWVVPVGVTLITVDAYGAQGGANWVNNINYGGYVQADIAVTPGSTINIFVGQQPSGLTGGFNGGGNGESAGQGGGGASDIRIGGTTLNDRVVVAGGAGGAGYWSSQHVYGGLGGGLVGGPGYRDVPTTPGGDPGTQTASGNGTCVSFNNPVCAGGFGFGGAPSGCGCEGYGGGGGWYGGAGSGNCRGGGGGSSYTIPSATNVTHTQGTRVGNGQVTISYSGAAVTTTQIAGLASGSTFPIGTTTNTFYASNTFGNDTCSFTVTVVDAEAPTITCPGAITINTDAGQCTSTASIGTATGTDNCGSPTITNNAPASFPIGNTTVTWTATDGASNTITCTQVVTVVDAENPTITCPGAITINTDAGQCTSTASIGTATGTDNCGSPIITNNAPASFPIGNTTVTWTSTDGASNTTTCTQVVTVVDAEAPIISCPANITVSNDAGMCDAVVTYTAPVGTDNCTGATTAMTAGLASGATFPVGVTTVTYTVTDAANNIDSCSFTVTVVDTTLPTVTCPANVASCDPLVNGIAPTTADNCTGETVAYTLTGATTGSGSNDASGTTFNVGTTTVQYVVTDASNNQDSCSFDVTINPLPTVAIAAFSPDTVCVTDPAFVLPVGTPAAGTYSGNGVSGSNFDPNAAGAGTHYVVYTYTDTNTCTNMDSTAVVVVSCVGINEANGLSGVNVYPNPANNVINVNLGAITTAVNFTLTSIDGKVVYQVNNVNDNKAVIDISNNAKGVYFLKIETNNKYNVYKVIKQ